MTLPVVVSATPLMATWPPLVIVHLWPLASVIDPAVPVTTVLLAEGVKFAGGETTGASLSGGSSGTIGVPPPFMLFGP